MLASDDGRTDAPLQERLPTAQWGGGPMSVPVPEEAVRIATRLRASTGAERVITFTSGEPGEGVSAVVCAVAAALAKMEAGPVLVVDSNLAAPSCHRRFGLASGPGLAEFIAQQVSPDSALRPTGVNGLWLLPAGDAAAQSGSLGVGAAFPKLIAATRRKFEYVLIDAPCLAGSPATLAIAAASEAVVLVVGAGRHSRAAVAALRRELGGLRTRLLGAVLSVHRP